MDSLWKKRWWVLGALLLFLIVLLFLLFFKARQELAQFLPQQERKTAMLITGLRGKRWCLLGDSITAGAFWPGFVYEQIPMDMIDCGISGTRVAGRTPQAFWTEERLQTVIEKAPDLISILGGTNDLFSAVPIGETGQLDLPIAEKDVDSYLGAYSYVVERLQEALPQAKIFLIGLPNAYSSFDPSLHLPHRALDYSEASAKLAAHYQLVFVDLYEGLGSSQEDLLRYFDDGVHPNIAGAKQIAALVLEKLRE